MSLYRKLPAVLLALLPVVVAVTPVLAQEADSDTERFTLQIDAVAEADADGVYAGADGSFVVGSDLFRAKGVLRFVNDGKWIATESWMPDGFYFDLKEGSISSKQGPFTLEGGFLRATHYASRNPYEQLLDASGKAAVGASFGYDGSFFIYQSRWISLNKNSIHTYNYGSDTSTLNGSQWLDRGLSHKLYLLKLGDFRLGYQESSIYLNRDFDANFFLNPAPSIFINTLWSRQLEPNPWVMDTNDSSMMGFYGDWSRGDWRAEAELILKDVNLPFGYPDNLNKFSWSTGAEWNSPWGRFSFWHGGATKHMYAATYQSTTEPNIYPYEYTYYPQDVVGSLTIALEDNYIGYKYGENSLAFCLEWDDELYAAGLPVQAGASLEYVLSGSKSPHNPWHEFIHHSEIDATTELFAGDDVLEHRLALTLGANAEYRNWYADIVLTLGALFNPLALTHTEETESRDEHPIWKPQAGEFRWLNAVSFRAGYILRL